MSGSFVPASPVPPTVVTSVFPPVGLASDTGGIFGSRGGPDCVTAGRAVALGKVVCSESLPGVVGRLGPLLEVP